MKFVDPVAFDSLALTADVDAGVKTLAEFDVGKLAQDPTVGPAAFVIPTPRELVNSRQNYWDGLAATNAATSGSKTTVRQQIGALKGFFLFQGNRFYPTSYLYIRNELGSGAHAIVPYRMERKPGAEGVWRVFVYDPNLPLDDTAFLEMDSTLNAWRYDNLGWGGGSGSTYLMDPIENYFGGASYTGVSNKFGDIEPEQVLIGFSASADVVLRGPRRRDHDVRRRRCE